MILTENIIEKCKYNEEQKRITWEICTLRKYLNNDIWQKFSKEQQNRIKETQIINNNYLWYDVKGGNDTNDKIFILSLDEVDKYFGNSGDYQNKLKKEFNNKVYVEATNSNNFSNNHNSERIARFQNEAYWWWLRTPGNDSNYAAGVDVDGSVYVHGFRFHDRRIRGVQIDGGPYIHTTYMDDFYHFGTFDEGGVRPALWLNFKTSK